MPVMLGLTARSLSLATYGLILGLVVAGLGPVPCDLVSISFFSVFSFLNRLLLP